MQATWWVPRAACAIYRSLEPSIVNQLSFNLSTNTATSSVPCLIMAPRTAFALIAGLLSLSCVASASKNYSSIEMMRAELALMDDRPKDCPPWYVGPPISVSLFSAPDNMLTKRLAQLQLPSACI